MTRRMMLAAGAVCVLMLVGCSSEQSNRGISVSSTHNPTAAEMLELSPTGSFFQHDNIVYQANVPWVDELDLTRGEFVAEVLREQEDGDLFKNGDANVLKQGTRIYAVRERGDVLIAETPEGEQRFYQLVEG